MARNVFFFRKEVFEVWNLFPHHMSESTKSTRHFVRSHSITFMHFPVVLSIEERGYLRDSTQTGSILISANSKNMHRVVISELSGGHT